MTLRTTAIIAGALGLLMLIAGLVANDARPDREVVTTATLDTPVLVLGPDVVALEGLTRIAVTAEKGVEAHEARAVDANAWLKRHSATYVTGYDGWGALATRTESRVVLPSEAPSASPSPQATVAPSPSPAPSDAAATPTQEATPQVDNGSPDHWRTTWRGVERVSIASSAFTPGETVVVFSEDGSQLKTVQFTAVRQVNDGWINPLIWIGAALSALGAAAFLSGLIDTRPAQAKVESWMRGRAQSARGQSPRPGSRRERRLAGSTLAPVELGEEALAHTQVSAQLTTHEWDIQPESTAHGVALDNVSADDAPQAGDSDHDSSTDRGGAL